MPEAGCRSDRRLRSHVDEIEFGESRLVDCLRVVAPGPAEIIVSRVFEEVDRFAGMAPQHDDITLMVLKRTS